MKKIIYAGIFFISTSVSLLLGGVVVYADTQVPAEITADTTWTLDGSPYLVQGNVNVNQGTILTIDPGVSVKFEKDENDEYGSKGSLTVFGDIHSNGTSAQPIDFSAVASDQNWNISFINSTSTLSYVTVTGSSQAIFGMNSNLKIDHLTATGGTGPAVDLNNTIANISVSDFGNGAMMLEVYNNSDVTVRDSSFHDIDDRFTAIAVFSSSLLSMDNVVVDKITNGDAISVYMEANLSLSSSTISHGAGNGMVAYMNGTATLKNTKISDFALIGIVAYSDARVLLDHSTVTGNDVGMEVYSPIIFQTSSSSISGNKSSGINNYSGGTIDASNMWWGDATGPYKEIENSSGTGNGVGSNVVFAPWLTADPLLAPKLVTPKCCSNVAFIPGLEGSRLYVPATLFGENQLWEPNRNADVGKLFMDSDGNSLRGDVYTKDIIDETKIGGLNIYKTFEQSMDVLVSDGVINKWKALPYDWRKGVSDLVVGGTVIKNDQGNFDVLNFVKEIESLAASSATGKATIIAHSNGGLIAKELVQALAKHGEVNLIDKVILVAVPELGTPKSIPALLHGFDQSFAGGLILNETTARNLGQNMPSVYNLLPSQEYFNRVTDPVVVIDSAVSSLSSLTKYGTTVGSFDQLQSFLLGQKDNRTNPTDGDVLKPIVLNSTLLARSDIAHNALDSWQFPDSIEVTQIAGWGLDTISGTKYVVGNDCGVTGGGLCLPMLDERPIFTSDGDNTVVTPSATAVDTTSTKTYYVNLPKHNAQLFSLRRNRGHADILEVAELQQLLSNIISDISTIPDLITASKPTKDSKQNPSLHLSVHSPVSIDAYDKEGNHTGVIPNPDPNSDLVLVEENIPNSFYMNFGEGKYIGVPVVANASVRLEGTGYGTFTFNIDAPVGSDAITTVFTDIPVTPMTTAHLDQLSSSTPQLALDIDGDGRDDFVVKPSNVFDPILYLQSMKQIVVSFNLKKAVEKDLLAKIDKALDLIKKGKIVKVESKVQKLIFRTEKSKSKKIDDADKYQFIEMLNQLLNNLK